jgi:hypothetical protein
MFTDQQLELANCKDTDPELFFSDEENRYKKSTVKLVKEICNSCEIKSECLQQAIANDMRGIWGGMTEVERTRFSTGSAFRARQPNEKSVRALKEYNVELVLKSSMNNLKYLKRALEILTLSDSTVELLTQRIKSPTVPMGELGSTLNPPLSRDAVMARLRRVVKEVKEKDNE